MKRILLVLVFVIALAVPSFAAGRGQAPGGVREIATGDDFFSPVKAFGHAGQSNFRWTWNTTNQHNVRQDDRLFYSGALSTTGRFMVTPSVGTFGYYCELHGFEGGGMAGELRIGPYGGLIGNKAKFTWASPQTDTGSQFDIRARIGKKKPVLLEERTTEFEGSFKVKPDKRYGFQGRSREGKAVSDWSPTVFVKR